jgi:hypothetical protein
MVMALARALYNLPKLSDDFMTLLRDLRKSAPDEDLMTQVRSASMVLDENVPETEALQRMIDYASIDAFPLSAPTGKRSNILTIEYPSLFRELGFDPSLNRVKRLETRLGRKLTNDEKYRLGDLSSSFATKPDSTDYRTGAMRSIENAPNLSLVDRYYNLSEAREYGKEAKRRMALEYLMGGLD